jgi:MarR family transcriptional regulator, organic hydroperoxide resistance regulator
MPKPFAETVSFLLAQSCRAHRATASTLLSELGLHPGQEFLLYELWQKSDITQSDLAEHLCVEAPTVTRMLQRMERSGLIERYPDPVDARILRVCLTERGRTIQQQVEEVWNRLEEQTVGGFTLEERLLLRRLLLQIYSNLMRDGDDS